MIKTNETRDDDAREREVSQERGIVVRFLFEFLIYIFAVFFLFPFSFSLVFFSPLLRLIICYLLLVDLSYVRRHLVEVYRAPRAVGDHLTHTTIVSKTP